MSFLSIYLNFSTVTVLFIYSLALILNKNNKSVLPENLTSIKGISGYSCALTFFLSIIFIPVNIGDRFSSMFTSTLDHSSFLQGFSSLTLFLICTVTALILLIVKPSVLNESALLVSFGTIGLILMIETSHLIGFYLGVELYSLSAYILASGAEGFIKVKNKEKNSYETVAHHSSVSAGLKYFLLSALSSGIILIGISIVYASTGELTLNGLSRFLSMHSFSESSSFNSLYLFTVFGLSLIISTLAFKIGSAPFHFWVPDVYSKVSLFVNFYLISVPKVGIIYTIIKFSLSLPVSYNLILIFSIASLIIGALGGLVQYKITRLLAYSSISHVGYILLALYAAHISYNSASFYNTLGNVASPVHIYSLSLYIFIYTIMTLNMFSILYILRTSSFFKKNTSGTTTDDGFLYLSSFKGLSTLNPFLAASLAITLLSMAGVPPLAGFVAKLSVYISVLDSGSLGPAIFAVLCSVVSAVYYLRVIKISYFYSAELESFSLKFSEISSLVISFCTLAIVFYPLLNPSLLYLALS